MAHISRTPSGGWRANWRDPSGRQKAKTFMTKKDAAAFLAEIEAAKNRGAYIDPRAGKTKFGPYSDRWMAARNHEKNTTARDASLMRIHVRARWADTPLSSIDFLGAQGWVAELSKNLAPSSVSKCFQLFSGIMQSAVRDRLIGSNPCEGVRLPRNRKQAHHDSVISLEELTGQLLAVVRRAIALSSPWPAVLACAGASASASAGARWTSPPTASRSCASRSRSPEP